MLITKKCVPLIIAILCMTLMGTSHISTVYGLRVDMHVICSDIDQHDQPIGFKMDFKREDHWVISWIKLINIDRDLTCTWIWKRPDKKVWTEASVEVSGDKTTQFVYNKLELDEAIFDKPGLWAVLFYTDGKYQFTNHFNIFSGKKQTTETTSTAETSMPEGSLLTILDLVISPGEGEPIYPGERFILTYLIENSGDSPAEEVDVTVEPLPEGIEFVKRTSPQSIPEGQKGEFTLEFEAITPGDYVLHRQIKENGEVINTGRIAITITEPDINITSVGVKTIPEEGVAVNPGDYILYTISLQNIGSTTARSVSVTPANIPEGINLVDVTGSTALQPGETRDFTVKFRCKEAGDYEIPLNTIVDGEVFESGSIEISVTEPMEVSWPIIGVLLMAVVIIVVVVLYRRRRVSVDAREKAVSQYCINCGSPLDQSMGFCESCGSLIKLPDEDKG